MTRSCYAWLRLLSLLCLLWPSLAVVEAQLPPASNEEMNLSVGENRTLSASDVKSFSEGAPGIVDVKVTPGGSQFVVVGQKPGATTLLLIKRDGSEVTWKINVFAQPVGVVNQELTQLLGDTPGVRVRRVGHRFFVEGGVSTEADLKRIEHIAGLYPGQVESLVVQGGVAADRKINIRVDLFFVQYNKTKFLQAGVGWPAAIGGTNVVGSNFAYDFLSGGMTSATAAVVNQPLPTLDVAQKNGWAKVIKHATVITGNGSEAEFASGGTQNFAVANGLTATIHRIQFGTTVKVLPRYDPKAREMQVNVGADIADLTPPTSTATTLPGQNTSKLNTAVSLKLGESLVLSGIHTEAQRRTKAGLPGISQIPILGALFGSTGNEEEDVEGAVFIVPSIVETVPQRAAELVDGALRQFDAYDGDIRKMTPFNQSMGTIGGTRD